MVKRPALVHLTDLVRLAGVVEDALARRRLAGVDVRHDSDVAVAVEWILTFRHGGAPSLRGFVRGL